RDSAWSRARGRPRPSRRLRAARGSRKSRGGFLPGESPCRRDELLEPWVVADRVEVGVDLQPARRQGVGNLQQRLALFQSLLGLAKENVDPHELVLNVRAGISVLRDRQYFDRGLTLSNRVLLSAEMREGKSEENVPLGIPRSRADLLLEGDTRLLGELPDVRRIAFEGIGLNEAQSPGALVVIERARLQSHEQLSLGVVEKPDEVLELRRERHERAAVDLLRSVRQNGSGAREVSLHEKGHRLVLEEADIARRQ